MHITRKSLNFKYFVGCQISRRGRGRGHGGVPPHSPPPPPPTIEQLLAVRTQLMQALVQNQQNQPIGGALCDKRDEFLKGHPSVFSHTTDPLEVDDWLHAVEKQLNRRCCTRQDNSKEKLKTGGRHSSMDIPLIFLLSSGRSLERILDLTTYQRD